MSFPTCLVSNQPLQVHIAFSFCLAFTIILEADTVYGYSRLHFSSMVFSSGASKAYSLPFTTFDIGEYDLLHKNADNET
jgi:hypothetical protein